MVYKNAHNSFILYAFLYFCTFHIFIKIVANANERIIQELCTVVIYRDNPASHALIIKLYWQWLEESFFRMKLSCPH